MATRAKPDKPPGKPQEPPTEPPIEPIDPPIEPTPPVTKIDLVVPDDATVIVNGSVVPTPPLPPDVELAAEIVIQTPGGVTIAINGTVVAT